MKLLIDIGNTSAKLAIGQGSEILHTERLAEPWAKALERLHRDFAIDATIVSCVGKEGPALREALETRGESALWLTAATPCAIKGVPEGYGADRLAADIGAYQGQHALLVIDAGTCITYDLIVDGRLVGGVISPGMQLRLNAMHDYTAALPQISLQEAIENLRNIENPENIGNLESLYPTYPQKSSPVFGSNTRECMLSAALHGASFEAEGYIRSLLTTYPDLCIVTTGGTPLNISHNLPYTHDPLLVLRGLNKIQKHENSQT